MAEFKILQENGVDIYPITHPYAVRDENGNHAIVDAPIDGKQYARKNGAWAKVQGGGSEDWEQLYEHTISEDEGDLLYIYISEGAGGQVLRDYKRIMIWIEYHKGVNDPTIIQVSFHSPAAWNGGYTLISTVPASDVATFAYAVYEKTLLGVVPIQNLQSLNNTNSAKNLVVPPSNTQPMFMSTTEPKATEFTSISVGSYAKVLGVGTKIIIFGKK